MVTGLRRYVDATTLRPYKPIFLCSLPSGTLYKATHCPDRLVVSLTRADPGQQPASWDF